MANTTDMLDGRPNREGGVTAEGDYLEAGRFQVIVEAAGEVATVCDRVHGVRDEVFAPQPTPQMPKVSRGLLDLAA